MMTDRELGNIALKAVLASVDFSHGASEFIHASSRKIMDDNDKDIAIAAMNEQIARMQRFVDALMDQVYG